MWEPGGSSSSNSPNSPNSNNTRGIVLLITVLGVCLLLYKAWGPLLLITCALVLVVHTCYSLLVNDSLLPPHTLVLLRYARELGLELSHTVKVLTALGLSKSLELLEYLKQRYQEWSKKEQKEQPAVPEEDMSGRHRNAYRLSTTGTDLNQNSPINNDPYNSFTMNGTCNPVRTATSTPLPRGTIWRKDIHQNGDIGLFTPIGSPAKKVSAVCSENRQPLTMTRSEQTLYSPKGSPWGTSISPKSRDTSTGIKTVQTVAGPLLTSSRYNIDPKVYTDISSPGLTSRLTKYAAEANNKLTHQPQYGAGQFPKVNLNASPTPLLSPKVARARIPVTVRVAPPEVINYSPHEGHSNQERHNRFSDASPSEAKESKSCPSVAQVLKEISLKRHASREDIMLDLVKKQRTERVSEGQLENLEEMMQKRAREESMTSDDDLSPQSKTERPLKRPKASSCHDILNSLSSSVNVFTGVKRKAMDTSRCNTPDVEKHFKPSSKSPTRDSSFILQSSGDIPKSKEQLNVKVPIINATGDVNQQKIQEKSPIVMQNHRYSPPQQVDSSDCLNQSTPKIQKEIYVPPKEVKLTDKLFMRAEPHVNEKLKNLIEEQLSVEATFIPHDKDEIKKQDIVNMRQNSVRLQSMSDALFGKSAKKIDPEVVIQAEEINPPVSSTYTSLSSLTSTTTVNTSPITTTIVPILKTDDTKSPTPKHVTFNLPSSTSASFSSATSSTLSNKEPVITSTATESKSLISGPTSGFGAFGASTTSAPSFNFGSNAISPSTTSPVSSKPTSTSGFSFSTSTSATTTASSSSTSSSIATTSSTTTNINSALFAPKSTAENLNSTFTISSGGFSFGGAQKATMSSTTTMPSASVSSFSSVAPTVPKSTETSMANNAVTGFGNPLSKSPASTSMNQTVSSTTLNFGSDKKEISGGFSFGNSTSSRNVSSTTTTTSAQLAPIFGMSTSSPIFSAGSNTSTIPASNAASTAAAPATTTSVAPIFSFGGAANKPTGGFAFGGASAATTTPASIAAPTSGFGSGAQMLGNASSGSATSTFAPPVASNAMGSSAVTGSNLTFGTSAPSLFGSSTNSSNLFSNSSTSTSAPMFKSPTTATTAAPIFGSQSSTPSFGTSPAAITTASTPSLFGNNATTTSTIPSLFGNTVVITAAPTISTFGGVATQQQTTQPSIFSSGTNATTAAPPSIFGSAASAAPSSGLFSGASGTSNTNLTSAAPTETPSIFGQTKASSTLSFGATNPSFGSTTNTSSIFPGSTPNNAETSAFQIGATSSSTGSLPSFNTLKPTPQFGAPTSNATPASSGSSIFGSTTSGGFGAAATTAPPAFGSASTSNAFGMQNNASPATSAFGTTANPPSFGAPAAASPFGAQATTAPTLFGNTAPGTSSGAPTNTGASFAFGGGQQPQTQQPQQSTGFPFGGAAPANPPGSSGIFQFGGAPAAKPAGFNFNAPTAAPTINFTGSAAQPPAFNAPPTNMFSIGSGSSTPRARSSRQRRQR